MKTIQLQNSAIPALIDDEDFDKVNDFLWHRGGSKDRYAITKFSLGKKRDFILMHRLITGALKEQQVHHRDENGLNNQKSNLLVLSKTEHQNTKGPHKDSLSRYKGVAWQHSGRKWKAEIYVNGRNKYLGGFLTEEEAAVAYDKVAKKYFGLNAYLNFPDLCQNITSAPNPPPTSSLSPLETSSTPPKQ